MKIVLYVAVSVLFSFMWIPMSTAESNNPPAAPEQEIQVRTPIQGEQIIPPRAGISWKEKVMMQREIKKRAVARRNTLMREAAMERRNESLKPMQQESPMEP
jgi:hypothetical protein